jgi:alkanesulfonate monooxygenase SsuD/methylene tetrahydromethanopterin reductase-like flavin-dependent oxidoreductase (luciferase family)
MGARGRNFYNDLMARMGYEEAARAIQDAFLDGRPRDAFALVPDAFVDEVALVGPPERIRDRLAAWEEAGVTTLVLPHDDSEAMRTLAELCG